MPFFRMAEKEHEGYPLQKHKKLQAEHNIENRHKKKMICIHCNEQTDDHGQQIVPQKAFRQLNIAYRPYSQLIFAESVNDWFIEQKKQPGYK